jgi:alpha-tubulin suppressor-like RCC1 family protein
MAKKNLNLHDKLVIIDIYQKYPYLDGFSYVENKTGIKYLTYNKQLLVVCGKYIVYKPKYLYNLTAGGEHSAKIDQDGQMWGWGYNMDGQLGDDTVLDTLTPNNIGDLGINFRYVSAGFDYTLALDSFGKVWGWGNNTFGQLGIGTVQCKSTPTVGPNTGRICHVSAGYNHSLAIDDKGGVWGWGRNNYGQVGDGTTIQWKTPISINLNRVIIKISAGGDFSLALDNKGRIWSWGYNQHGMLGDDTVVSKRRPVLVEGERKTFSQISAGYEHSLALTKTGDIWAWGINSYGGLGDNTTIGRYTPISIHFTNKTFCHIQSGRLFSTAIDNNGQVWSWGYNNHGQLGDNSTISRITPVTIQGNQKTFCYIYSGDLHTVAIDNHNDVWAWGYNNKGQLGDNTTIGRHTPVRVCSF